MSDWTVHLEFEEGTSSKFWRARVDGKTLYVNYGKIGSNGQTQVKDLADAGAAKAEYERLVRDKRKKGYQEPAGGAPGANAPAEDADEGSADDGDDDEPPARKPAKPAKPAPAAAKPVAAATPSVPGHRFTLEAGSRKVETTLYLDGTTVRMDSVETYASPEAAKKAFDRLQKVLAGEGYKAS
jgi:predicted DNA-binding WGR domain protein